MWKYVEGYKGYMVSEEGEVINLKRNGKLNPYLHHSGYLVVKLYDENVVPKTLQLSRVVAGTFIPNPENKPEVNHIDGDKLNNNVSNLEWVTGKENIKHAVKLGLIKPPEHPIKKGEGDKYCFEHDNGNTYYGTVMEFCRKYDLASSNVYYLIRENKISNQVKGWRINSHWRRIVRETGLIEWVCRCGCGHPDMDSVHKMGNEWGIHGCDGCCNRDDFPGKSKVGLMTKLQATYGKNGL